MAKLSTFRARRRSAAEKRALLPLQRHIGSVDRLSRRKYLQDFTEAYQTYERVISKEAFQRFCAEADTLLESDFHALDSCLFFLCGLLEEFASTRRPIVLLLEAIFTRDQHLRDAVDFSRHGVDVAIENVVLARGGPGDGGGVGFHG